jgi:hypothetical protein
MRPAIFKIINFFLKFSSIFSASQHNAYFRIFHGRLLGGVEDHCQTTLAGAPIQYYIQQHITAAILAAVEVEEAEHLLIV